MERGSGILMPVFSLPSPYGIGSLGKAAYDFADFLHKAKQKYWQMLPVGEPSNGNSPYQCVSSFAGNPYFIDLDMLAEDGLLTEDEIKKSCKAENSRYVDYNYLYETRNAVLSIAKERGWDRFRSEIDAFTNENHSWLDPYCRYMALKKINGMTSWDKWTVQDVAADSPLYNDYCRDIELYIFIQFEFYSQWMKLKQYVNDLGIKIIGDIPVYVPMDSVDVWAEREMFKLNSDNTPVEVAGVPPDYFSEDGQLWGNPLYDYDRMKNDGFGWWIRRVGGAAKLYDMIRIDHFRGFSTYWAVPAGEKNAKNGVWRKGPGMDLVGTLTGWFGNVSFIAEDLGVLTPDVYELLDKSGLPGMKVLEFAFTPGEQSAYMPHLYKKNCICYTGTHDNAPVMLWKDEENPETVENAKKYLGLNDEEGFNIGMIRGGMSSVADTFIAQMQDWLGLGAGHRTNIPGTVEDNWKWRMLPGEASDELADKISNMTILYGR